MEDIQATVETRLAKAEPEVDVILVEPAGRERLRIYIDHPNGVDLGLCERVTKDLSELLDRWSLEVSSPGSDRPLTKTDHFRRYLGHTVRVRTRDALDGQRSFTGTLTAADEDAVRVDPGDGEIAIPRDRIHRSNLVPEAKGVR